MLSWLSQRTTKYARSIVITWAVFAVLLLLLSLTGFGGSSLFARFTTGTSAVSGSESAQGQQILDTLEGDGETVSLLISGVDISTEEQQDAVSEALEPAHEDLKALAGEYNVVDPFILPGIFNDPAAQALISESQDGFLILVSVDPNGDEIASEDDEEAQQDRDELRASVEQRLEQVPAELQEVAPSATGIVADEHLAAESLNEQVENDLIVGELISLPLALLVMVLVFGGFLAAGMPLIGAGIHCRGLGRHLWADLPDGFGSLRHQHHYDHWAGAEYRLRPVDHFALSRGTPPR